MSGAANIKYVNSLHCFSDDSLCEITVEGTYTKGLIDTGADISIMDREFSRLLKLEPINNSAKLIREASGGLLKQYGTIRVNMQINEDTFCTDFIVVDKCHPNVILGMDFLKREKATINCGKKNFRYSFSKRRIF